MVMKYCKRRYKQFLTDTCRYMSALDWKKRGNSPVSTYTVAAGIRLVFRHHHLLLFVLIFFLLGGTFA